VQVESWSLLLKVYWCHWGRRIIFSFSFSSSFSSFQKVFSSPFSFSFVFLFFVFFHFHFIFSNSLFFFVTKQIKRNHNKNKKGIFFKLKKEKINSGKVNFGPSFWLFSFFLFLLSGGNKTLFFFLLIVLNYSSLKFYSTSFYQKMLFDQNIILFSCLFLQLSFG